MNEQQAQVAAVAKLDRDEAGFAHYLSEIYQSGGEENLTGFIAAIKTREPETLESYLATLPAGLRQEALRVTMWAAHMQIMRAMLASLDRMEDEP